jgi:hypothetical protein
MTKTLLVLSVVGLVTGFAFVSGLVNVGDAIVLYVTLPAGAVFFGLFLISKLLEKEAAILDAEMRLQFEAAIKSQAKTRKASKPGCERSAKSHDQSPISAH